MKYAMSIMILIATMCSGALGASEFTMPFGLPVPPEARLLISDQYDSGVNTREESIARFGTHKSLQEVIAFFQSALADAGFKVSLPSDRGESVAITARRDRDRIRITVTKAGSWADEGENELIIVAVYDK